MGTSRLPSALPVADRRRAGTRRSHDRVDLQGESPLTRHRTLVPILLAVTATVSLAQSDPRAALLGDAGWTALAAGRPGEAAEDFRIALTSDAQNPRLHLGAGVAAYAEHRDQDARSEFEHALTLAPDLTEARLALARVEYRMGDRRSAIASLEMIPDASPRHDDVGTMLERWRREIELHDSMNQVVGTEFTISFSGPSEEALATEALASLDRAYWRIGAILGTFPTQPTTVILYTTDQFRDITRAPSWAAGAYDGIIRVPMRGGLEKPTELDRVLAHEFTHAVVHSLAPRGVPAWLNEGLASALENDDLSWAERLASQTSDRLPLRALTSGFSQMTGSQAQLAYAESALVARRLLEVDAGAAVVNLLRDLAAGVDFDNAFTHRFHRSFAEFQAGGF